jgi:hypothetical protein
MTDLTNPGFSVIRSSPATDASTIIVVGVARSGTSMIASVLHELGVPMGDRAGNAVYEDPDIASAIESGNKAAISAMAIDRNARFRIWGFKRPEAFLVLPKFLPLFRNPRIISTFRDPAAISQRNSISMHQEFLFGLGQAAEKTLELTRFIKQIDAPVMAVSYEKAMGQPHRFMAGLINFCGLSPSGDQYASALRSMGNGPELYLKSSRIWFEGWFDNISNGHAIGWVRRMPTKDQCQVEIVSNGRVIGRGKANAPRKDLAEKVGDFAFSIELSEDPCSDVFARVAGTTHVIGRSKNFQIR